jgi:hypothetical protein
MRELEPWIGVDLDGTLALWTKWVRWDDIGDPIPRMVERVKRWLAEGKVVKVFTARVAFDMDTCGLTGEMFTREEMQAVIRRWSRIYIGTPLESTAIKDFAMIELWDDKAIGVVANTGLTVADEYEAEIEALKGKPDTPPPGEESDDQGSRKSSNGIHNES